MVEQDEKRILETPSTASTDVSFDSEILISTATYKTTTTNDGMPPPADASSPEEPLAPQLRRTLRRRIMSLELPVFLLFLAVMISGPVMLNQELYQTCVAVYHYNKSACEPLRGIIPKTAEAKVIENSIQPFVAQISMTSSILNNVWPGIVVLFIGPWSDKFGRRPVLLVTYAASFIGYVITATLVRVSETMSLNPWFYLLGGIPFTIVGGGTAMMTIVFCYISDVSDMESKAKRMFYIDMAMGLGLVAGNVLGSYLLRLTSVAMICATSAVLVLSASMYVFFFIGESLDVEEASFSHKIRNFFDIGLIRDLVKSCMARRPNYGRAIIGCTTSISVVTNFIMSGEISIFYLFLRNKFNVTLQQFTYYNAAAITVKMLGCGVVFGIFRKLFKVSFAMVAMMGLAGSIFDSLTRALAQSFWQMYMASCLGFMSGITGPMLQAIISFAVPSNEIGKVFSLSSCAHTLTPLAAAPLYTLVYNHTINFYPGFFNFISVGLYAECIIVMILVYTFQRRIANRSDESRKSETEESQIENISSETTLPATTS